MLWQTDFPLKKVNYQCSKYTSYLFFLFQFSLLLSYDFSLFLLEMSSPLFVAAEEKVKDKMEESYYENTSFVINNTRIEFQKQTT